MKRVRKNKIWKKIVSLFMVAFILLNFSNPLAFNVLQANAESVADGENVTIHVTSAKCKISYVIGSNENYTEIGSDMSFPVTNGSNVTIQVDPDLNTVMEKFEINNQNISYTSKDGKYYYTITNVSGNQNLDVTCIDQKQDISNFGVSLGGDGNSLKLTWNQINDPSNYDIYVYNSEASGNKYIKINDSESTTYTFTSNETINYRKVLATYGIVAIAKNSESVDLNSESLYKTEVWQPMYRINVKSFPNGKILYNNSEYRIFDPLGITNTFQIIAGEANTTNFILGIIPDSGYGVYSLSNDSLHSDLTDNIVNGSLKSIISDDTNFSISFGELAAKPSPSSADFQEINNTDTQITLTSNETGTGAATYYSSGNSNNFLNLQANSPNKNSYLYGTGISIGSLFGNNNFAIVKAVSYSDGKARSDVAEAYYYRLPAAPSITDQTVFLKNDNGLDYQKGTYSAQDVTVEYKKANNDFRTYDGMEIGYKTESNGSIIWKNMSYDDQSGTYQYDFNNNGKYMGVQLRNYLLLNGTKKYSDSSQVGDDKWIGIDKTVPDVNISRAALDSAAAGWSNQSTIITLSNTASQISDTSYFYYVTTSEVAANSINNSDWISCSLGEKNNQIQIDCTENANLVQYVYVKAKSGAGVESQVKYTEVKLDKTVPVNRIYAPENPLYSNEHEWYSTSNSFNIILNGASDDGGAPLKTYYTLKKDGEALSNNVVYDTVHGIHINGDGKYTLQYYTKDSAGNTSNVSSEEFWVDVTAPNIALGGIANGVILNQSQTLNVKVDEKFYETDNVGVEVTREKDGITSLYNVDSFSSDKFSSSKDYFFTEDGTYTVSVNATDAAGNRATSKTVQFTIDKTNPQNVTMNTNVTENSDQWYKNLPTITIDDSAIKNDLGSSVSLYYALYMKGNSVGEQSYHKWNNSDKIAIPDNGIWELSYYTKDAAGNKCQVATKTYQVDTNKPNEPRIVFSSKNTSALAHIANFISFGYFCNETISVTIDSSDSLSGVKGITYWTTENGIASKEKVLNGESGSFTLPLDFKGKVSAYATDTADNISKTSISDGAVYENTNADITITADKDCTKWQSDNVGFHVLTQDKKSGLRTVEYQLNGKVVYTKDFTAEKDVTYSDVYDVNAVDEAVTSGGYTLEVKVVDNAGNVRTDSKSIFIDKTAPEISLSGIDENSYSNKTENLKVSLKEQIFDKDTVSVKATRTIDGVSENYNMDPYISDGIASYKDYSFSEDGLYTVTVNATDAAGNMALEKTITFTVDKTAPVITITGTQPESYNASDVNIDVSTIESFYNTDNVNITVTKTLDGASSSYNFGTWNNTAKESSLSHTFKEDGTYLVEVNATDASGNVATKQQLSFTVDKTAPQVAISGANDYFISGNPIALSYDVTESYFDTNNVSVVVQKEDVSGNVTTLDVGAWNNTGKESSLKYNLTEDGVYTSTITAVDKAGNKSEVKKIVTIDTTNPVIRYVDELNGKYIKSFKLNHNINDMIVDLTIPMYSMYLNSNEYDGVSEVTDEGKYVFKMDVSDEVGHKAVAQAEFIIDHTAPTINITGVSDGDTFKDKADIAVGLSDPNDSIESISIDGEKQDFDKKKNTFSSSMDQIGSHTLEIKATDYAGNDTKKKIDFEIAKTGIVSAAISSIANHKGAAIVGGVILLAGTGTGISLATGVLGGAAGGAAGAAGTAGSMTTGTSAMSEHLGKLGKLRKLFRRFK